MRRAVAGVALVVAAVASVGTQSEPPVYLLVDHTTVDVDLGPGELAVWRVRVVAAPGPPESDWIDSELSLDVSGELVSDGPAEIEVALQGQEVVEDAVAVRQAGELWLELRLNAYDPCEPVVPCEYEALLELRSVAGEGVVAGELDVISEVRIYGTDDAPEGAELQLEIERI